MEKLYDAAIEGNVSSLLNLLKEDPLILDRCIIEKNWCIAESPLHVAASHGHAPFVKEILRRKPELAEVIDSGQRSSPLHLASARGHLEIVMALTAVNPDMCLAKDRQGRNSVHVAAIRGQVHVLDELIRVNPQSGRERTNGGETALHLCVKHRQIDAMRFIVKVLDDGQMINSKDSDGNTVLHLAVVCKCGFCVYSKTRSCSMARS